MTTRIEHVPHVHPCQGMFPINGRFSFLVSKFPCAGLPCVRWRTLFD
jgi:hypothetical protein